MQTNPVGWFEIYVKDMKRAKAFYEGVLAVELKKLGTPAPDLTEMWSFPMEKDATGAAGALVKMEGGPSNGNATIVYFTCADCAKEASRVESNGGQIKKDKFAIGEFGFIALVSDTEGNVIGLHSLK